MEKTILGFGNLLIVLGMLAYFGTGNQDLAAMLPTFIGFPISLLGVVVKRQEAFRLYAIYGVLLLSIVGFFLSITSIGDFFTLLTAEAPKNGAATMAQMAMAIVCFSLFVLLAKGLRTPSSPVTSAENSGVGDDNASASDSSQSN